jgi:hypothetical protein
MMNDSKGFGGQLYISADYIVYTMLFGERKE